MNDFNSNNSLGGYLEIALDFEDRMSNKIYDDYLSREAWPSKIDEEVFAMIKDWLIKIINDTERHKQVIVDMMQSIKK